MRSKNRAAGLGGNILQKMDAAKAGGEEVR